MSTLKGLSEGAPKRNRERNSIGFAISKDVLPRLRFGLL